LRKRSSALGVGTLIFGLLVAGCGSDSAGSSGQKSVQEVNVACKASNKKTASEIKNAYIVGRKNGVLGSERKEIQLEVTVLIPIAIGGAQSQVAAIDSLEVPSGDEAQVKQILEAYRTWIEKAKATPFKMVVANDIYNKARERAGKYGLDQCEVNPFEIFASSL
jgi:hypothetical protein